MKHCIHCGRLIRKQTEFCYFCGAKQVQKKVRTRRSFMKRLRNTHYSNIFKAFSVICVVIALSCLFYERVQSHLVNGFQEHITRQDVEQGMQNQNSANYNMKNVKSASVTQAMHARATAGHIALAGQMLVPSMGIHLPIGLGGSNPTLMLGAGTMRKNQKMGQGNYALAGHHMISKHVLFTPLWYHAKQGTLVYITDMKNIYVYRIYTRRIISPYDVGGINNTRQPLLTLITCNNSGSKRLLLRGKLVRSVKFNHASKPLIRYIQTDTNNHNVLKGY